MEDVGLRELAPARARTQDGLLSVEAAVAAVRTFGGAAVTAFIVTVGIGAVSPTWGLALAEAIQRLYLAPGSFLAQYLSAQVTITLANSLAALGAALLGACGALLVARIHREDSAAGRTYGALGRASYVLVSWLCRAARRCAPALASAAHIEAQAAAAIAVVVPRLSVACSGSVLGIYLAGSLLRGWTAHLIRDVLGLLPHGVCEVPALIASATIGICIAERLVAAAPAGVRSVHESATQLITSPRLVRILGIIFAAILIGAAMEVRTM